MRDPGTSAGSPPSLEEDDVLAPWLSPDDGLAQSLARGRFNLDARYDAPPRPLAYLRSDRFGVALVDRFGVILAANDQFAEPVDTGLLAQALTHRHAVVSRPGQGADGGATTAYGALEIARDWALPDTIVSRLSDPDAAGVILSVAAMSSVDTVMAACRSYGLTPSESDLASALVRFGDLREAARQCDVTYSTARTTIAEAMARMGVSRQSALIEKLLRLSFGHWPEAPGDDAGLLDAWGLSSRQAALAYRVSLGMSRSEAARATGVSEAVAKKELTTVFWRLGVESSTGLTRSVTEARALSLLTDSLSGEMVDEAELVEPLRLLRRPGGGQVAFSDYGPRSGRPVLVLHSSSSSRPVPRRLLRALHDQGFRPLAIDRPGFGLTDPVAGPVEDPFTAACSDVALVCQTLKIARLDVIARGGAQVALALQKTQPDLLDRVVLINPDPPTRGQGSRSLSFTAVKALYATHPGLIGKFAHMLARHVTMDRARQVIDRITEGSPIDQAAMADPVNFGDFARGIRMFSAGRVSGYVAEQIAMTRSDPAPLTNADAWDVFLGAGDSLHDPGVVERYWRSVLPGAVFTSFADGGRFIAMTHAAPIVAALASAHSTPVP